MNARRQGWLVLADICGYTRFLTETELEHAAAIIDELIKCLLASVRDPLRLVKLEGDAIFAYALDDDVDEARALVDRLEDAYHGFRMHLFNIERSSSCTCAACAAAPSLDLKFMLHHGEFLIHDPAGHDDLQGPDVILVHRLLKNEVVEQRGLPAYLLASPQARALLNDLAWIDHEETYEHLGTLACGVRDMHEAHATLSATGAFEVPADEAHLTIDFELDAPPAVAWDWHVDSEKVPQWQGLDRWRVQATDKGRIGPGSVVHCGHGADDWSVHVVGWRPFHALTTESRVAQGGLPANRTTIAFVPLDAGTRTRVVWRLGLLDPTALRRAQAKVFGAMFRRMMRGWVDKKLRPAIAAEVDR